MVTVTIAMTQNTLKSSELILNPDGSIYHLNAFPEDIADTVITVGDPDRVSDVSRYFDKIEVTRQKREFVTHTGWLGNQRLTVISTGIGVDNIDIVLTELDALVNVDFETRLPRTQLRQLDIIRLGTCGGLHPDVPVDAPIVSCAALGFDNLMHYYDVALSAEAQALQQAINAHMAGAILPYVATADQDLVAMLAGDDVATGITATCPGFYGPQGRTIRAQPKDAEMLSRLQSFSHEKRNVLNFEMETSGILGLGRLLGHRCCSVSVMVANRVTGHFSDAPGPAVDAMIQTMLTRIKHFSRAS
jgi:uridine phosphorylase